MITGNLVELYQIKSVIANSMSVVHTFIGELMRKSTIEGQTETEKELADSLELLYQNSEEVLSGIDQAIRELPTRHIQNPDDDRPPWKEDEEA